MTQGIEPGADKREYPERPILGVAAVVIERGCVLLIQRGKEPRKGMWSLPGGVLELGESIESGVVREAREEAGLDVRPVELVEVLDHIVRDEAGRVQYHYILLDWLCTIPTSDSAESRSPVAGSDAQAVAWLPLDELETFELDAVTMAVIRRSATRARELRVA